MTSFTSSLLSRSAAAEPSRRRKARSLLWQPSRGLRARPQLEALEDRLAPASLTLVSGSYLALGGTSDDTFWLTPGTQYPFHDLTSPPTPNGSYSTFTATHLGPVQDTAVDLGSSGSIASTSVLADHGDSEVEPVAGLDLEATITPDSPNEHDGDPVEVTFTLTASASDTIPPTYPSTNFSGSAGASVSSGTRPSPRCKRPLEAPRQVHKRLVFS